MDLGAAKGSLVGESEKAIRRAFEIVKTMGGNDVLFIATCNKLETLPPEFQARFNLGTWMWDSPTKEERKVIWDIQRKAFNINEKDKTPNDEDWVGRDIRNCCQMSWMLNTNLKEASEFISIAGKTAKPQIESLRKLAAKSGFRSASYPGAYCEPRKEEGRKLSLEN
jgi:SpoVK/Ycf46/Vps4 family AAA+-type ATPase